jgi:hypothetical protein
VFIKPDVTRFEQAHIEAWSQPGALACNLKYYYDHAEFVNPLIREFLKG